MFILNKLLLRLQDHFYCQNNELKFQFKKAFYMSKCSIFIQFMTDCFIHPIYESEIKYSGSRIYSVTFSITFYLYSKSYEIWLVIYFVVLW